MSSSGFAGQQTILVETAMTLMSDPMPPTVQASFHYAAQEPFAVRLALSLDDAPAVQWVFARDLIVQGVRVPSGHGDIQFYPTSEGVVIELHSPDGDAHLLADEAMLTEFADAMEALVPSGRESDFCSMEQELTELLSTVDHSQTDS
ncbi:MAG: SsgA family sporulation/cell division regulator [Nakamurella sp.]